MSEKNSELEELIAIDIPGFLDGLEDPDGETLIFTADGKEQKRYGSHE